MCKVKIETVKHLFKEYSAVKMLYTHIIDSMGLTMPNQQARKALTRKTLNKEEKSALLIAQFIIWRERCSRIFTDTSNDSANFLQQTREQWSLTRMTSHQNSLTQALHYTSLIYYIYIHLIFSFFYVFSCFFPILTGSLCEPFLFFFVWLYHLYKHYHINTNESSTLIFSLKQNFVWRSWFIIHFFYLSKSYIIFNRNTSKEN